MSPIRVGILGLSQAGWAPSAHLPYLQAHPEQYQIEAICNSSVESSQAAIKKYGLPFTTKAYGNPDDLAKDSDIDLVVCSVRVDRHLSVIKPSLLKGKNVYVEWPLGKSLADAKELLRLKNEGGVKKTIVGLQSRKAPIVNKIKEVLEAGRIGDVLSSVWTGQAGQGGEKNPASVRYLSQIEAGGNILTIHFGHVIDYIQHVLGYFEQPPKSLLASRRKTQSLVNSEGKVVEENFKVTTVDTIFIHGISTKGIPISATLRGGPAFQNTPGMIWSIIGTKGEIRVTSLNPFLGIGTPNMKIELLTNGVDEIEEVKWDEGELGELSLPARNVGRVYEAYAKGGDVCTFEDAVVRHAMIEGLYVENGFKF